MFICHSVSANESLRSGMPKRLRRCYGGGYLHFITSSCFHRRPILGTARRRTLFLELLEQVRRRYGFVVVGYVVMPEHFHLLISEPERGTPSTVMQVLKQRFARRILKRVRAALIRPKANSGIKYWRKDMRGSGGSTISWSGAMPSGWRSSATSTAIRSSAAWCCSRSNGGGAVFDTMPTTKLVPFGSMSSSRPN